MRLRRIPYRAWLLIILLVALGVSAIGPWHPTDFYIEHVLTLAGLAVAIVLDRRRPLSNITCTLVFVFLMLHVVGAHYTYSEVPYDAWAQALTGRTISDTFGWQRNHFDRLVHLSFGLLMVYPAREVLGRVFPEIRDARLLVLAVLVIAFCSKLYELMEWGFTLVMTQEAAATYNGEQGDVYDALKDMALALAGSIVSGVGIWLAERACASRRTGSHPGAGPA